MTQCSRCRKQFENDAPQCPYCGERRPGATGMFHTSTVLISAGREEWVCRTVEEVPPHLRRRLIKSTNSANSATILIADRRGRLEIARALRKLPSSPQRRLRRSMGEAPSKFRHLATLGSPAGRVLAGWGRANRRFLLPVLVIVLLLAAAVVFSHRW